MKRKIDRSKVTVKKADGTRTGRGFSSGELKEAGLTPMQCRVLGHAVDIRRKSTNNENVDFLKTLK